VIRHTGSITSLPPEADRPRLSEGSGTAIHPSDQLVAAHAVLVSEIAELVQGNRIGRRHPRRVVGWPKVVVMKASGCPLVLVTWVLVICVLG
jgi:hypothetical protein